jgi:peptidoglycan/xylan/chitin deacetylase (PgdA/CDA1 family)
MKLPDHNRYDYIPIHKRPQYEWPEGARLAVTFCNNIEHFAFGAGLGSDSTGAAAAQSQRNYAWRDYGNRVGIWYYLDLLDEFGLPGAHNVNSAVLEQCPDIVERLNGRGDEYVGHGRTNSERQDVLWEEDEARLIAECTEVLTRLSGKRPEGWLGPYIAQSGVTLDLLQEARYRCHGLGDGRPAGLDADPQRADLVGPVPARDQRLAGARLPAPHRSSIRRDGRRPIRRNAGAIAQIPSGVRSLGTPFHHRPAVSPARVPRRRAPHCTPSRPPVDHDTRRDRTLL